MDLLKPKKRVAVPDVSIILDQNSHPPFRPGSRVTGRITLHSTEPRGLVHAEAIFFGRVVTHATRIESQGTHISRRNLFFSNGTAHYHDDACLFRFTQDLSKNIDVQANRTMSFSFDFSFADSAKLVGRTPYQGPTAVSDVYAQGEHPLPPTFERYFNDHHYAFIEYRLQAVFQFSEVLTEPVTVHLPLNFFPSSKWPDPSRISECVRAPERYSTRRLLPDNGDVRRTFGGRSDGDLPSVDVVIKASLRTQAIAGSAPPVYVCVEMHHPSSSSIVVPHIDIKIKSITLYQVTVFRARQVNGSDRIPEYQEVGEDGTALHAYPERITVKPRERKGEHGSFHFFAATFEFHIPDNASPSFNTFNINNNYQVIINIEADVCGKSFKHECKVESFTMLPPS